MDMGSSVLGILASLITAGLLAMLAWSRGWLQDAWYLAARGISLTRRLQKAGVINFYASGDDYAKYRGRLN